MRSPRLRTHAVAERFLSTRSRPNVRRPVCGSRAAKRGNVRWDGNGPIRIFPFPDAFQENFLESIWKRKDSYRTHFLKKCVRTVILSKKCVRTMINDHSPDTFLGKHFFFVRPYDYDYEYVSKQETARPTRLRYRARTTHVCGSNITYKGELQSLRRADPSPHPHSKNGRSSWL